MPDPFLTAVKRQDSIARAAAQDRDAAADLYNAVASLGEPRAGTFAAAVADTSPVEDAALLARSGSAVAFAFRCQWEAMPRPSRFGIAPKALSPLAQRDIARKAWAEFDARAKLTGDIARGFGWDLSDAWEHLSDTPIATGDTSAVQRIAKLAGRMYAALRGANAQRVKGTPEEVHSVELGADVGRLLPVELGQLVDPDLEAVAAVRFSERRMLQYAMRGTSKSAKGPLVIALDESASMHDARREWSKACAIALTRVAFDDKRPVAVVHYSTSSMIRHIKPGDAGAIVAMIQHWYDGGTQIGRALDTAADAVQELAKKGAKGADIVLVTDGQDGDTEAQEDAIKRLGAMQARLWLVGVEVAIPESSPLRRHAAQYTSVGGADLTDAKSVTALGKAAT